jgi:ADP-ribose pyrophosphatase
MLDYFPAVGFSDERMSIFLAQELEFVGQEPDEDEWVVTHICSRDRIEQLLGSKELLDGKTLVALLHWLGRDR